MQVIDKVNDLETNIFSLKNVQFKDQNYSNYSSNYSFSVDIGKKYISKSLFESKIERNGKLTILVMC